MGIISRMFVELGLRNKGFKKGLKDSEKQAKGFGSSMKKIGSAIGGYFAFTAVIAGVKKAIQTNIKFEKSLSSLKSLTGATSDEVKFYSDEAKRMGSTTTQSASQVADAFTLIGSKKPELLNSKEALSQVTKQAIILAEAANIDVVQAATALTGSLNQMGKGASSANKFINILAAGSKVGAADISFLNAAISKAGGTADAVGLNFEELVAGIETIAPKIAEPTTAGLQFRQVLVRLAGGIDKFNPSVVGLSKALHNLQGEQLSINELTNKFGILNINAAKALIDGADAYDEYKEGVTGTNTALEQQAINIDNVQGSVTQLSSAWEGFVLNLQEGNGAANTFLKSLTGILFALNGTSFEKTAFESLSDTIAEETNRGADELELFKTAAANMAQDVSKQMDFVRSNFGQGFIDNSQNAEFSEFLVGSSKTAIDKLNKLREAQSAVNDKIQRLETEKLNKALVERFDLQKSSTQRLINLKRSFSGAVNEETKKEAAILLPLIKQELATRASLAEDEVRNKKNITAEIKALQQTSALYTGEDLIFTNQRIAALTNELNALKKLGLEIDKNATKTGISGKQTTLGSKAVDQSVKLPPLELPAIISPEGTVGESAQLNALLISDRVAADQEIVRNQLMQTQNAMNAYGSVMGSVGQIASAMGDSTIATFANVASQVISSVAQMMPALFSQSIGGAVAAGSSLPFPANLAAIAAGVAGVVSAFSGIGGGSASTGGGATTSIDTRGIQSPSTNNSNSGRIANAQSQNINVEVTGTIKGKDIALANNQGQKQLAR